MSFAGKSIKLEITVLGKISQTQAKSMWILYGYTRVQVCGRYVCRYVAGKRTRNYMGEGKRNKRIRQEIR